MKRVLKVGDIVYGISLQNINNSYLNGFPQREQYLLKFAKDINFSFFRHKLLDNLNTIFFETKRLNNFLKSNKFDYILVDNPISALIIEDAIKIPIIFDCIDWYDEMYLKEFGVNSRYYLLRFGYMNLLNRAQKVIAQSPVILDSLKIWRLKTKNSIVIPNGYDQTIFYPYSSTQKNISEKKIAKKYKIDFSNKRIIVYTGKISLWYDQLLNICKCLNENDLFFIIGDGPLLNKLPNRKNIIKCGRVDLEAVPDYTNTADVLVFPVSEDCSPIVISEYLAVGKPIVTPYGRMGWLLKDKINVFFIEKTVSGWKDGIRLALKKGSKIKRNNIQLAQKLSWQLLSKQFCDFIS